MVIDSTHSDIYKFKTTLQKLVDLNFKIELRIFIVPVEILKERVMKRDCKNEEQVKYIDSYDKNISEVIKYIHENYEDLIKYDTNKQRYSCE